MVSAKASHGAARPPLPLKSANSFLMGSNNQSLPPVKFQIITREGQDIIVGRVKINTPNGHAFILRRFDTGALSLTTMFRAAFPGTDEEAEKVEGAWVKANFESPGTNGTASGRLRLAGTWVTPTTARELAEAYRLQHVVAALLGAKPDPGAMYRRSTKASGNESPTADPPAPAPSRPESPSVPNKRARPSSPTRASARLKSPAPAATTPARATPARARATPTRSTPARASRATRASVAQPMLVDETPEEDDAPEVPGPDPEQDIAESKALVQEIMAQGGVATANTLKRSAADQRAGEVVPLVMNLDRPSLQVDRPIATNRRINIELNPEQKALAWGTLAFAFGMGVTSFILPMLT
ncbi:hypothetical protein AURDEDRAFT_112465 [Auricularia subglabra TFB-10046 SS5]|nr:hypothetical protein AURDEDRAFT_112465 [Auricularia subglabra TFB-10046 SS5]